MRWHEEKVLLAAFLSENCFSIGTYCVVGGVFAVVALAFRTPIAAVGYAAVLCVLTGCILGTVEYLLQRKRLLHLYQIACMQKIDCELLEEKIPVPYTIPERWYQQGIISLLLAKKQAENAEKKRAEEMITYYQTWAHQMKVPISAMLLLCRDREDAAPMRAELTRIEQYTDMVMTYQRLESHTSDYVFAKTPVNPILCQAIRKNAVLFIRQKITLHYTPVEISIFTDEKWLSFVVEQLLSNAIKYTPPGGEVWLWVDEKEQIHIRDNGIGIAAEDLPRIFECGYTGKNGRTNSASSGIGLYLCKRICDMLGYTVQAVSTIGKGSELIVDCHRENPEIRD